MSDTSTITPNQLPTAPPLSKFANFWQKTKSLRITNQTKFLNYSCKCLTRPQLPPINCLLKRVTWLYKFAYFWQNSNLLRDRVTNQATNAHMAWSLVRYVVQFLSMDTRRISLSVTSLSAIDIWFAYQTKWALSLIAAVAKVNWSSKSWFSVLSEKGNRVSSQFTPFLCFLWLRKSVSVQRHYPAMVYLLALCTLAKIVEREKPQIVTFCEKENSVSVQLWRPSKTGFDSAADSCSAADTSHWVTGLLLPHPSPPFLS